MSEGTFESELTLDLALSNLMAAIQDTAATRNDVAECYADAILLDGDAIADFSLVNARIRQRWSWSALEYIKRRAWRIAREGHEIT